MTRSRCWRISFRQFFLLSFVLSVILISEGLAEDAPQVMARVVNEPVFGAQVHLREAGIKNQKILLLVHGIGDRAGSVWDELLPELAEDYHVVAPDLPGFGLSSKGNHLYSPEAYGNFLAWLIKSLPTKPVTLVGHSLGGGIALMFSSRSDADLERLILIDSVGVLHRLAVGQNFIRQLLKIDVPYSSASIETPLGNIASLLLEKASRLPINSEILLSSSFMRQKFLAADPTRIAALALVDSDYSLLLSKPQVPTWLIWGEKDEIAPLRIAKILDWNLPQSKLNVLPESGHSPMLDNLSKFRVALQHALQEKAEIRDRRAQRSSMKVGRCDQEDDRVFTGSYASLEINECRNVLLKDVMTHHLEINDSQVEIEASQLHSMSPSPALSVLRSKVILTGVDIVAEIGIVTNQSRIDLAGVRFRDVSKAAVGEGNPSSVLCSSSVRERNGRDEAMHFSRSLVAGEEL